MSQTQYTKKILSIFNINETNAVSVPAENSREIESDTREGDDKPYRELIGSLLYLSTITPSDISYAVNYLSRYVGSPKICHWLQAKKILRYLRGTTTYGIQRTPENMNLSFTAMQLLLEI